MDETLAGLKEIALPEHVSYAPQTAAWYILFGLIFFGAIWIALRMYRTWAANRYRREALIRLADIQSSLKGSRTRRAGVAALPALVKQTALAFASRESVAGLSGNDWLAFLDSSYSGRGFSEGAGRLLPELSYQSASRVEQITDQELADLFDLLGLWIRRHRAVI